MGASGFTVYDLLARNAELFPEHDALVDAQGVRSFAEVRTRVDALAGGLAGLGLNPGDAVCVLAYNDAAFLELYLACARQGIVVHPLNWRLTEKELGLIVDRAAPRLLVVDDACQETVKAWPETRKGISHCYHWGEKPAPGFKAFDSLYQNSAAVARARIDPEAPFVVLATAAVDVVPRGAVLTHANVLWANQNAMLAFHLTAEDVNLGTLPLFHIAGLGTALAVMHAGGANVIMPRFDAAGAVRLMDTHAVTHFSNFPPVLGQVLDAAKAAGTTLPSLRIVSGLDAPATMARLHEETGAVFWTGFGQAETSGFITLTSAKERPGTAGRPGPMVRLKLVDDYDRPVPTGQPGEILVRGPMVFQGYHAQPEVTAHTFRGDWHHTGDVGRLDEEGCLHYVRRKPEKELIKPGGENVYPAEVEAALLTLPGVTAACVFGVPDAEWGEAVRAVVQTATPSTLTEKRVIDHVAGAIARYKKPKAVFFTEALPRTPAGEVDREAVKKQWGAMAVKSL
ncbi:MAG: AMP-binding protein [Deltaproteobacteria bacterium]|nr:AMP-binding protein [Deltaproteobacteria bacterium]